MLPYRPQSLTLLRSRLPAALDRVYGLHDRSKPWHRPEHVFDFESGLRLVVTIKIVDVGCEPCLHVIADVIEYTMLWEYHALLRYDHRDYDCGSERLKRMVPGQFREIAPVTLEFLGHDNGLIPHFFGDVYEMAQGERRLLA